MAVVEPIKVAGLSAFSRSLRKIDSELPKALRIANNEAADIVVGYAVPRVPTGPKRGGHAKRSIKAKSTRTAVRVSAGGKRQPYYAWLDFGGRVGINRSIHRRFIKGGRYLYPGFTENREAVQQELTGALVAVAAEAGLEVAR